MVTMLQAREDAAMSRTLRAPERWVCTMAKVLVVDDEEQKRTALTSALRLVGFETQGVCSAEAAHRVGQASFDVAIIDLMLHGTNGFELARQMRVTNPSVRVVLTSAYHLNEHQLARMDCGAIGFVPQPFALDELAEFLWAKLATPAAV